MSSAITEDKRRCPTCHRNFRRTHPQNSRYWLLVHKLALRPIQGSSYSPESWHEYLKGRFLGCNEHVMPNGKTLTIPRSTAGLSVSEFNEYMERVEAWAADHGIFLEE
jgi:hypothetical protein